MSLQGGLPVVERLICSIGTRRAALPLEHVREVMRALPLEPVAQAPDFVIGVALIRGEATPVVDLAKLLGSGSVAVRRFVTLRVAERTIALAVGDVLGTKRLGSDQLGSVPALLAEAGGFRSALATLDGQLLEILETARLFDETLDAPRGVPAS